jgi:hypothetical protein
MKIDVEGGEYEVLRGAETSVRTHRIRDVVFEEYNSYPTKATEFLETAGYTLFSLNVSLRGLVLSQPNAKSAMRSGYIPTYLATTDPDRAVRRLEKTGWAVLRAASRQRFV